MRNKSILLVDDEENILASISWVLEKNNFKVTTATQNRERGDGCRWKSTSAKKVALT